MVPATRRETGEDEPRGGLDGSTAREHAVPEVIVTVISRPRVSQERTGDIRSTNERTA